VARISRTDEKDREMTTTEWTDVPERQCRACGTVGGLAYRIVESRDGAYEDINYHCASCNANWWIDGIDS